MADLPISSLPSLASPLTTDVFPIVEGSATYQTTVLAAGKTILNAGLPITSSGITVTGSIIVTKGITGSLQGTATNATSASYALTASYSNTSTSASYALSSSRAVSSSYAITSSYSNTSTSASYAVTSSYTLTASFATGYTPTAYLAAYHTSSLTVPATNTAYTMSYSTVDFSLGGITISGSWSDKIKIADTGIYNIQFSAQTAKSTGTTSDVSIWLAKNGVEIPYSNTVVTLAGGANDVAIPAWNFFVSATAGDYYQLLFATTNTNTSIKYTASGSVSPAGPAVPSIILTVNRVG
jgi:hypothetical protein